MRRDTPRPCSSPVLSALRMSRSRVPCRSVVRADATGMPTPIESRYEYACGSYRMSIGVVGFGCELVSALLCLRFVLGLGRGLGTVGRDVEFRGDCFCRRLMALERRQRL